jgi:hypothetical protein
VKFIVVGGVAALLEGAPLNTFDLDVVHATDMENVRRALAALAELDARYRHRPELRPSESHLTTTGHQLLATKHGALDFLGAIGASRRYEDLLPEPLEMDIAGATVRVLGLEALIRVKEETGEEKDRAVLPLLRRVLQEKRAGNGLPPGAELR